MKVDFHVHTSEISGCARSPLMDQVESAVMNGVDVIFITDHMKLHPKERLDEISSYFPTVKVYQGIEVTITDNNYEDIVVIGVHDPAIERRDWTYPELYKFVKSKGGVLILAHPYRFSDRVDMNIWDYAPDGVEVMSGNLTRQGLERRKALATRLDVPMVTNSDSHHTSTVGCYTNEFPDWCNDEASIIQAILDRNFSCTEQ